MQTEVHSSKGFGMESFVLRTFVFGRHRLGHLSFSSRQNVLTEFWYSHRFSCCCAVCPLFIASYGKNGIETLFVITKVSIGPFFKKVNKKISPIDTLVIANTKFDTFLTTDSSQVTCFQ